MNEHLRPKTVFLILVFLALAYAVPVISCWNKGYLDFGDGNYMYISWRVSQGAMLYRDILAPQPPLHLYVGAALAWIGDRLLPHPIWAFRTFSLVLHLATMLMVWATARRMFSGDSSEKKDVPALLAAAIYLVLPIGFWWTLGYQSQPLLIFLLLCMFYGVLRDHKKAAALAGLAGGLGLITNMTTAPYVLFTAGWLLLRRTRQGFLFSLSAGIVPLAVIPAMELYTKSYVSNVIRNQVGAFPRADILAQSGDTVTGYITRKLITEGGDVLLLEGTWVALAIIGMIFFTPKLARRFREYAVSFAFFSLCCIIYVAKGGTVDYVFSVAEPYVALFAAPVIASAIICFRRFYGNGPCRNDLTPLFAIPLGIALGIAVMFPGIKNNIATLQQNTYELNEKKTLELVNLITANSRADQEIIAPPHLAFIARRKIAEDYSEHLLWRLKYMNERFDNKLGRGVEIITALATKLEKKQIPYLVLDLNQTGAMPEIAKAVKENYTPQLKAEFYSLNTPFQLYKPKP